MEENKRLQSTIGQEYGLITLMTPLTGDLLGRLSMCSKPIIRCWNKKHKCRSQPERQLHRQYNATNDAQPCQKSKMDNKRHQPDDDAACINPSSPILAPINHKNQKRSDEESEYVVGKSALLEISIHEALNQRNRK